MRGLFVPNYFHEKLFLRKVKNEWIKMPFTKCFSLLLLMRAVFLSLHTFSVFNWLSVLFPCISRMHGTVRFSSLNLETNYYFIQQKSSINSEYNSGFNSSSEKCYIAAAPLQKYTRGRSTLVASRGKPMKAFVSTLIFYLVLCFLIPLFLLELIMML